MLVITRREGESIFIGDEIEVVILETGSTVSVGINAPREVTVVRTELIPPDQFEVTND
jgi:carbon storage regulator